MIVIYVTIHVHARVKHINNIRYICLPQEQDVTGATEEFKYRIRRVHTFALKDGSGTKQAFELSTFCVTAVANKVVFKAEMNEHQTHSEGVCVYMLFVRHSLAVENCTLIVFFFKFGQ